MDKIKFFLLIISTLLSADNLENLLIDIQNNNRLNLEKNKLSLGWNEKEKVFIASGYGVFDFNKTTFIEDKRRFSNVASIKSKTAISEFVRNKLSGENRLKSTINNDSIESIIKTSSNNFLYNSYTIFEKENYNKKENIYTIINYTIYTKNLNTSVMKSDISIDEYMSKINLEDMSGSRFFINNKGEYFLLTFSMYPVGSDSWKSRVSADNLAKKDLSSMLQAEINSHKQLKSSVSNTSYNSSHKENVKDISTKNMQKIIQKKIKNRISGENYFLSVYSYKLRDKLLLMEQSKEKKLQDKLDRW